MRVIQSPKDLGRGKLLRLLVGSSDQTLFHRPYGVVWDGDDLLVADPSLGRLIRIDARGKIGRSPEGSLANPMGVAACPFGIVVTDSQSGKVVVLDRALHRIKTLADNLLRPTGIVCNNGRVYVTETGKHRILVLDSEGRVLEEIGARGAKAGQFNFPTAITLNHGDIWVGDTLNFKVHRLEAATGKPVESFGDLGDSPGEMPRIKGLAIDSLGNLWVSDAHLNQVALFRPEGTYLMSLGRLGPNPGQFSFPAGIAAHPDGRVAIADSLNRRIQIFRAVGTGPENQ